MTSTNNTTTQTQTNIQMVKEGICRSIEELTPVDLFEIYQQIRSLPHVQTDSGFLFDLDESYWTDSQLRMLWDTIVDRKRRIRDVMNAEQLRSDVVELMQPSHQPSEAAPSRFCTLENGTRAEIVRNVMFENPRVQKRSILHTKATPDFETEEVVPSRKTGGKRTNVSSRAPIFKKKKATSTSSNLAPKKTGNHMKSIMEVVAQTNVVDEEDDDTQAKEWDHLDDEFDLDDSVEVRDDYDSDDSYGGLF